MNRQDPDTKPEHPGTIGERIRAAREKLAISQGELARRMNANNPAMLTRPETISRYEAGKYVPSIDALAALAESLETSADALLGRSSVARVVRDDDLSEDPTFRAFLTTLGADTSEEERRALSDLTRRLGRPRDVDSLLVLRSMLRSGFSPSHTEQIEREHQARRTKTAAEGRIHVDRKAAQERARKNRGS